MNVKYIRFSGKHPEAKKENRQYFNEPDENWHSYGCSYSEEILKFDVDDYSHKTDELDDAVRGEPRSEALIKVLDDINSKYNGIKTEHGKQFYFRVPECLKGSKNKINWYTPIGIKSEWKFSTSDDHIPLKVNGVERHFFKGSIDNTDIDELPFFLYPLQKSKERPFDINFQPGERTQQLGGYLFHLIDEGFTPEQAFEIVRIMNEYVFDEPIPDADLNSQILNERTMKRLQEAAHNQNNKNITPNAVGENIIAEHTLITVDGVIYRYENGIYAKISDDEIKSIVCNSHPTTKSSFRREVVEYIKDKQFKRPSHNNDIINVKNGLLTINEDNTIRLTAHTPEHISFKQFNAMYIPDAKSELLEETLLQWFKGSKPQIELFKQMLGYLMMNHTLYSETFFFVGMQHTGKSSILQLIENFCGKENVSHVPPQNFNKEFALEPIINTTANIVFDLPKAKITNAAIYKALSTGDTITINRKNKSMISYEYSGKMLYGTNYYPNFGNDFAGISRRCTIFKFDKVFKRDDPGFNPHLKLDLATDEHLSALLNMAIEGYISLRNNKGFSETKESIEASVEFEKRNDNIVRWLSECEITEDVLIRSPIKHGSNGLYYDYAAFCINTGEEQASYSDFRDKICEIYHFRTKQKKIPGGGGQRAQYFYK